MTPPRERIEASFDALLEDFRFAAADRRAAERLTAVGALCVIRVAEAPELEIWLRFDQNPVDVTEEAPGSRPEIELVVPAGLLDRFWDVAAAMAIVKGQMTYTGQVRRLLQLMPVLRTQARRRRQPATEERTA